MITWFRKEYWFLSNQYRSEIEYKGIKYPSVENAFQAQKYEDDELKKEIALMTPKQSKKAYRKDPKFELTFTQLKEWDKVKRDILKQLNIIKYKTYPELAEKLLATGDEIIIEGNNWNDNEYGIPFLTEKPNCKGKILVGKDGNYILSQSYVKGKNNKFGEILMEIRDELRHN